MTIQIQQEQLKAALSMIKLGIASNPILPILEDVKVLVSENNLRLQSTDNRISMTIDVEVDVKHEGGFTLSRKAVELINSLKKGLITLFVKEKTLHVIQGKSSYKFPIGEIEDFPTIKTASDFENPIEVEYENFKQSLVDCIPFCSKNEMQAAMTGVCMGIDGSRIQLGATNAHILNHTNIESPSITGFKSENVIVPIDVVKILKSLSIQADFCQISLQEHFMCIKVENLSISCRLIDENFPAYKRIIPQTDVGSITFNCKELKASLKRLALLANATTKQIAVVYQDNGVALAASDLDFETDGVEVIPCEVNMEKGHIGLNINFLLSVMDTLKKDTITLTFSSNTGNKAIIIKEDNESVTRLALLMPVVLNEVGIESIREKIQ